MQNIQATSFGSALRNQFRFVHRSRKRTLIIFSILAVAVACTAMFGVRIPVLHGTDAEGGGMTMRFEWFSESDFGMPAASGLLAVALGFMVVMFGALSWPFWVWGGEEPRTRTYHWLMPIARWKHDLARVVAGAVSVGFAILLMWLVVSLGLLIGGRREVLGMLSPAAQLNLITGPITVYLLVSIVTLAFNRPGRVFALTYFTVTVPYIVFAITDVEPLYNFFYAIAGGPYSYGSALVGGLFGSVSQEPTTLGSHWPAAAALWFTISLAGVVVALSRHREN